MKLSLESLKEWLGKNSKGLSMEKVTTFVNTRNPREKIMLIVFSGVFLLMFDYWVLVRPVQHVFNKTWPELGELQRNIQGLDTDSKNKALIEKNWKITKEALEISENAFIEAQGVPSLLENLSKLATDSGVRLISIQPIELKKSAKTDVLGSYARVPIKISAQAGTHELGAFLARLEGGETFFRVTNLIIKPNPNEARRHMVELDIDAYRRG